MPRGLDIPSRNDLMIEIKTLFSLNFRGEMAKKQPWVKLLTAIEFPEISLYSRTKTN